MGRFERGSESCHAGKVFLTCENHMSSKVNKVFFLSFREPLEHFGDHFCSKCGRGVGGMTKYALNNGLEEEADAYQAKVMSSPGN